MKLHSGVVRGVKKHASQFWQDVRDHASALFHGAETPKERIQRTVKHGLLLLAQLCLVLGIYAAGCALASVLPIAIPGNILGMVLLLLLLATHVLKTTYVSEACNYLIDNMSIFFIPAGVAIMGCFSLLEGSAAKFAFVCVATTVIVFLATSLTVMFVSWLMAKVAERKEERHAHKQHEAEGLGEAPAHAKAHAATPATVHAAGSKSTGAEHGVKRTPRTPHTPHAPHRPAVNPFEEA